MRQPAQCGTWEERGGKSRKTCDETKWKSFI